MNDRMRTALIAALLETKQNKPIDYQLLIDTLNTEPEGNFPAGYFSHATLFHALEIASESIEIENTM